jgi:VWFA-related protein
MVTGLIYFLGGRQFGGLASPATAAAAPKTEGLILPKTRPPADVAGRLFIVFIDDLHLTPDLTPRVKDVLKQIRDNVVHENDLVGFVSTGYSSVQLDPAYDFGHRRFDEVINKVMGSGATIKEIVEMPQGGDGLSELNHKVQVAFWTAYDLLDQLEAVTNQRKAFIYVSSGYSLNPLKESRLKHEQDKYNELNGTSSDNNNGDGSNNNNGNNNSDGQSTATDQFGRPTMEFKESDLIRQLAELIRAANRANTSFFPVDPRGLMAGPDSASLGFQLSYADWRDWVTMSTSTLKSLAEETGGIAAVDTNDLKTWMQKLDNMTSDYYMLGYQSSNPDPLHLVRKIEVRVKKPGIRVEAGRDYKPLYILKKPSKQGAKLSTAAK